MIQQTSITLRVRGSAQSLRRLRELHAEGRLSTLLEAEVVDVAPADATIDNTEDTETLVRLADGMIVADAPHHSTTNAAVNRAHTQRSQRGGDSLGPSERGTSSVAVKEVVRSRKVSKIVAASKPRTKGEIYTEIAEHVGLSRKQVANVFDTMGRLMEADLGKGTGFTLPGVMRIQVVRKPSSKELQRPNPFKPGEMMSVKSKPARNVVKVRPLKALKSMV